MRFSRNFLLLIAVLAFFAPSPLWADEQNPDLFPHGRTEGIDPPVKGIKETFSWHEAIGKRVRVEGLAWGSFEKGYGEYVILNGATVFMDKNTFLDKKVHGKTVRVSGVLRLKKVGGSSQIRIFVIEHATNQPIEKVEWPWLARDDK